MSYLDVKNLVTQIGISLTAVLTLAGCTTTTTTSYNVSKNPNVESVQIATDADFSQYNRLLAEDMGIFFPSGAPLSTDEIRRLRQIFRDAFFSRLQNYTITDQAGPRTMAVQATLIDLRNSSGAEAMEMRRDLRDVAKTGSLVFLMELRDSQTSKTLARAADSAAAPVFATSVLDSTDWDSVETAANRWAELFVNFLDQNLGR